MDVWLATDKPPLATVGTNSLLGCQGKRMCSRDTHAFATSLPPAFRLLPTPCYPEGPQQNRPGQRPGKPSGKDNRSPERAQPQRDAIMSRHLGAKADLHAHTAQCVALGYFVSAFTLKSWRNPPLSSLSLRHLPPCNRLIFSFNSSV
jgi:hypothetical protein